MKTASTLLLADDGEQMLELRPGQFVSETVAHFGFVHPYVLADSCHARPTSAA